MLCPSTAAGTVLGAAKRRIESALIQPANRAIEGIELCKEV
jgi:hypothetical protein